MIDFPLHKDQSCLEVIHMLFPFHSAFLQSVDKGVLLMNVVPESVASDNGVFVKGGFMLLLLLTRIVSLYLC